MSNHEKATFHQYDNRVSCLDKIFANTCTKTALNAYADKCTNLKYIEETEQDDQAGSIFRKRRKETGHKVHCPPVHPEVLGKSS